MARETKARKVGTVTVLFTDLVGSTELLDRVGDDAADHLRRRHFRMLRQVVREWGGLEVKSLGDGLMIVFSSAYEAAACSIAIQRRSAQDPDRPQVRVGLHSGEVAWEEEDVFGTPVVVAKRLCDSAGGGQILASDLVRNLIGSRGGFSFRDVGFMELKGLSTPIPATEIVLQDDVDETEPSRAKTSVSRRFGPLQAIGVGIGALLIAAAVILLSGGDEDETPNADDANSGSNSMHWTPQQSEPVFSGEGEQAMLDVVDRGSTFIVPGRDGRGGDPDAVVWRRGADGTWREIFLDSIVHRAGEQIANGIAVKNRLLVAVGVQGEPGQYDGAAWISRNGGLSWVRGPDSEADTAGLQVMNDVASRPGLGLVAVGYEALEPGQSDAAVWLSHRGVKWTRTEPDPEAFGGPGQQEIREVTATGNGFVAVGRAEGGSEDDEEESDAAVWVSVTGNEWERVEPESLAAPGFQTMSTVVRGEPGYIAAGFDSVVGDADAAVWTSPDSIHWTRVDRSDALFGGSGSQKINVLARDGNRFIAAGFDGSLADGDAGVWTSTDGVRWTRESGDAVPGGEFRQEIDGLIVVGGRAMAVGHAELIDDLDAAVWTARIRRP